MTAGALLVLAGLWVACSVLGGWILALLAKRLHPALSLRRLWVFYTGLLAFAVAAFMAIALR